MGALRFRQLAEGVIYIRKLLVHLGVLAESAALRRVGCSSISYLNLSYLKLSHLKLS